MCDTPGQHGEGCVYCLWGPRQGYYCESHLVCELPLPMTGTILSTILCSLGQRSLGPQSGWVGGWGWAQAREEVQGEWSQRHYSFRICWSKGQGCSPSALGMPSAHQKHAPESPALAVLASAVCPHVWGRSSLGLDLDVAYKSTYVVCIPSPALLPSCELPGGPELHPRSGMRVLHCCGNGLRC